MCSTPGVVVLGLRARGGAAHRSRRSARMGGAVRRGAAKPACGTVASARRRTRPARARLVAQLPSVLVAHRPSREGLRWMDAAVERFLTRRRARALTRCSGALASPEFDLDGGDGRSASGARAVPILRRRRRHRALPVRARRGRGLPRRLRHCLRALRRGDAVRRPRRRRAGDRDRAEGSGAARRRYEDMLRTPTKPSSTCADLACSAPRAALRHDRLRRAVRRPLPRRACLADRWPRGLGPDRKRRAHVLPAQRTTASRGCSSAISTRPRMRWQRRSPSAAMPPPNTSSSRRCSRWPSSRCDGPIRARRPARRRGDPSRNGLARPHRNGGQYATERRDPSRHARESYGPERWDRAAAEGAALTVHEAIDLGLDRRTIRSHLAVYHAGRATVGGRPGGTPTMTWLLSAAPTSSAS